MKYMARYTSCDHWSSIETTLCPLNKQKSNLLCSGKVMDVTFVPAGKKCKKCKKVDAAEWRKKKAYPKLGFASRWPERS